MKLKISIVIPTYHRKYSLLRLLESLGKDNKIIIVEQEENNRSLYEDFAKKLGMRIKYVFLNKKSMTHARNVGVKYADGDLILFLDDDDVARSNLVGNYVRSFSQADVGAVCGRVITFGGKTERRNKFVGRVNFLGRVSGGFSSTIRQEVDTVIGCNMCWRKEVWERLGGMDEQFRGNALREETDLSLRAKKLGYKLIFEPKAVIEHIRANTGGARKSEGRIAWYFDLFSNETYFFLKHRTKVLLPIFLLMKTEWALRCMFGFGREVSLRSLVTPFAGIVDGVRKYSLYDHRR